MNRIDLTNNKGYKWFNQKTENGHIWVKGFWVIDGKVLRGDDLVCHISQYDINELPEILKPIEGQFSLVIEKDNSIFAAVDHMRCFPLLYKKEDNGYCVFDTVTEKEWKENKINEKQKLMLLSTTFTIENNTIFDGYFQIPAGRYLLLSGNDVQLKKYWDFYYAENQITDKENAVDLIYNGYKYLFEMCKNIVAERTVVIPLSGGYDSRLVLNGLLKAGVSKDKIITFTCGMKAYDDSRLSKRVADAVGVKNYYINYNTKSARRFFKRDLKNYALYASGLASIPHIQEWYGISELVRQNIIDENCVFMPGYGGILPGHYIQERFLDKTAEEMKNILRKEIAVFATQKPRLPQSEIDEVTDEIMCGSCFDTLNSDSTCKDYIESYERFIYMEEQVKHIQNSTRNYEYVNCEWLTAFFFKEQYDLWSKIDNSLRVHNIAFMESVEKYFLPELLNVPFTGSKVAKKKSRKNRLKMLLVFLFNRTKVNYIFGMFPYSVYYKYFFRNLYVRINYSVGMEMLKLLKK